MRERRERGRERKGEREMERGGRGVRENPKEEEGQVGKRPEASGDRQERERREN